MQKVADNIDPENREVKTSWGHWSQTEDEVNLVVQLPTGCKARNILVDNKPTFLSVSLLGNEVSVRFIWYVIMMHLISRNNLLESTQSNQLVRNCFRIKKIHIFLQIRITSVL